MIIGKDTIRKASLDDLEEIFKLYTLYMFDSYLVKMRPTLLKTWLRQLVESTNCVVLCSVKFKVTGFIVATLNSKKLYREFLFSKYSFVFLKEFIFSLRIFKFLVYPFRTYLVDTSAEMLFIVINPEYRNSGIAQRLILRVLKEVGARNVKKIKVTTVVNNMAVNNLLNKMMFRKEKIFKLLEKDMFLYSCNIANLNYPH